MFSPNEKEIYENLIRVAGSEMDIRIRQNIFLAIDKINNNVCTDITQISSGSLAEGLDLPGSDMDIMFVFNDIHIIQNVQHMYRSARYTIFLMEDDMEFPGFSRLKLKAAGDREYLFSTAECFVDTTNGMFLSNIKFISKFIKVNPDNKVSAHGPCVSNKDESVDLAFCFHSHSWPKQAEQWIYRHRYGQWPPAIIIEKIVNDG